MKKTLYCLTTEDVDGRENVCEIPAYSYEQAMFFAKECLRSGERIISLEAVCKNAA